MNDLDLNNPDHYTFAYGMIDGGMLHKCYNQALIDIDLYFHKEPVYKKIVEDGNVVEKQVDTIIILRADKLRQNGYQIGNEYDDLEERESLNHLKDVFSQMGHHGIDMNSELISKLLERHIQNKEESKQFNLNI
jgi:hypothetical protein